MSEQLPVEEDLTFNIIYTPGTFAYLGFLTLGLLSHSKCSFRLAANGCEPKEIESMKSFCRSRKRLSFLSLPFLRIVHHSIALNYLQKMETSNYFCFMDSDILAADNFLTQLLPLTNKYCAIFSGRPAWLEKDQDILPPGRTRVMGRFRHTNNGLQLGCSYFAIYDNRKLTRFIKTNGFGFDNFYWQNIPPQSHLQLVKMGLPASYYDTGKVLNILLQESGEKLIYCEPRGLHHIGGLSCGVLLSRRSIMEQKARKDVETELKRVLSGYFIDLFHALVREHPLPPIPVLDKPGILKQVEYIKEQILSYYHEYREQF
jgi:hypothetical protein